MVTADTVRIVTANFYSCLSLFTLLSAHIICVLSAK